MNEMGLIKISTLGWFYIFLSLFVIAIICFIRLAIKKHWINESIKYLEPNRKYLFCSFNSKSLREYIELNDSFAKGGSGCERFFIRLKCKDCGSYETTFGDYIKGTLYYGCNDCEHLFEIEVK